MADPLSALAEREVPAPTNFFNPDEARNVIARYGNTRREREGVTELAESAGRLSRVRDDEEARARQQVTWDRADVEYEERQNAKRMRGDFLRDMQKKIDPTSPDYTKQVVGFKASLPPDLQEDEVINSILTSMNAEADDFRSQRNAEASKQQTLENTLTTIDKRAGFKLKHIKPEDYVANQMPDGSPNWQAIMAIENERDRGYKEGEFNRKLDAVNSGRVQVVKAIDLSRKGRERRSNIDKFIVEDRGAFPRRMDALMAEYKQTTGKTADPTVLEASKNWRDKFAQAKAWDAKILDSELSAAFAYDDADEYVKLGGEKLTDSQKDRRRMVWEHAHQDGAVEEVTTPAPTGSSVPAANAAETSPPAPATESEEVKVIGGVRYVKRGGKVYKE